MRKIIIASHHQMAYGLYQTVQFLTKAPQVYEISAYVDDIDIQKQIEEVWTHIGPDDEVFIFTDIIGGSVTQKFFSYKSDKVHLICGMNLPLVIAAVLSSNNAPMSPEEIRRMVKEAQDSIIYINEYENDNNSCEDE